MKNTCEGTKNKHTFFEIKKIEQSVPGSPSYRVAKEGVHLVCAFCGEVREIWDDGEIIIAKEGKSYVKKRGR